MHVFITSLEWNIHTDSMSSRESLLNIVGLKEQANSARYNFKDHACVGGLTTNKLYIVSKISP